MRNGTLKASFNRYENFMWLISQLSTSHKGRWSNWNDFLSTKHAAHFTEVIIYYSTPHIITYIRGFLHLITRTYSSSLHKDQKQWLSKSFIVCCIHDGQNPEFRKLSLHKRFKNAPTGNSNVTPNVIPFFIFPTL